MENFYPPGWHEASGAVATTASAGSPQWQQQLADSCPSHDSQIGYKLFRVRKDGSLGPLFINRKQRIEVGVTYPAEDHPTKGFAHRMGWHICSIKSAPHLRQGGDRLWAMVEFSDWTPHPRPKSQGGLWYTANRMRVLKILP